MQRRISLMAWYDANRRILPWREDPAPYRVWLSEIMLQQTRVEAVKPYFARFIETLPDVQALAEAEEDVYLKLWEGLGYYSRVRNLNKAANVIVAEHGGAIPDTFEELRTLPGIGEYTAAAIASIAFGQPVPAIDGNLLRIFARLTGYDTNVLATGAKKAAYAFFSEWIDPDRPGQFNQALMDLGAMICLPNTQPLCDQCPLQEHCTAHREGRETQLPVRIVKKKKNIEQLTVLVIHHRQKILLRKRPAKGLLAGLYEFPNVEGRLNQKQALQYVETLGFTPLRIRSMGDAKHIFSHKEWKMKGFEVFTGDWTDAVCEENTEPYDGAGEGADTLFLAAPEELENRWSIPTAFSVFRAGIRKE